MKLSGFWAGLAWDQWLYGLIKGSISGGATSVCSAVVALGLDPHDFALGSSKSFKLIAYTFVFAGLMQAFAFLSKTPLPDMKKREESMATVSQSGQPTITVETVKETSIVPKDSPS